MVEFWGRRKGAHNHRNSELEGMSDGIGTGVESGLEARRGNLEGHGPQILDAPEKEQPEQGESGYEEMDVADPKRYRALERARTI